MNFLMHLLIPGNRRTVRIRPDHLPGLTPPKAAAFKPQRSKVAEHPSADIDKLYKRFLTRSPMPDLKRACKRKGLKF